MPSKKQYNLVSDDAYDSRIPLHSEEAFQHGIPFSAKYIGTLDVPRPSSRVEIVAAMRRIRYEFKAKSIKKKKVTITISVDGVKIVLRKKKKNQWSWDDNRLLVMSHPIYRIFYVSHDSQDLKIFSYIARDGGSNSFKCNVFKSNKKSQAMRIVRTVGQAFEVCHKLSLANATSTLNFQESLPSEKSQEANSSSILKEKEKPEKSDHSESSIQNEVPPKDSSQNASSGENRSIGTSHNSSVNEVSVLPVMDGKQHSYTTPSSSALGDLVPSLNTTPPEGTSLSLYHQLHLMKAQMDLQTQQVQSAMSEVKHLKEQLSVESTARMEVQAQNQHLITHNRELLQHIQVLVKHIQDMEKKIAKLEGRSESQKSDFMPSFQISPPPSFAPPNPPPRFSDYLTPSSQNTPSGDTMENHFSWLPRSMSGTSSPIPGKQDRGSNHLSAAAIFQNPISSPNESAKIDLKLDDLSFSSAMKHENSPLTKSRLEDLNLSSTLSPVNVTLPRLNPPPSRDKSSSNVIGNHTDFHAFTNSGSPPWSAGPSSTLGSNFFSRQFSLPLPGQDPGADNLSDLRRLTIEESDLKKPDSFLLYRS